MKLIKGIDTLAICSYTARTKRGLARMVGTAALPLVGGQTWVSVLVKATASALYSRQKGTYGRPHVPSESGRPLEW